jgi:flagellar protein FliO/FliZ
MDYIISIFKAIFITGIFAALLFLAYVTTRFIGGKAKMTMRSKNMKIIESISLGPDKRIHLMKVGGQYLLLSSSGKSIEFLSEIKPDALEETEPDTEADDRFGGYLLKYMENLKTGIPGWKQNRKPDPVTKKNLTEGTLGKNLARLKNLTSRIDIKVKNDDYKFEKRDL